MRRPWTKYNMELKPTSQDCILQLNHLSASSREKHYNEVHEISAMAV